MAEELDMKGLFYRLANAEQEGEDAVMDRKKITRALKVCHTVYVWNNKLLIFLCFTI